MVLMKINYATNDSKGNFFCFLNQNNFFKNEMLANHTWCLIYSLKNSIEIWIVSNFSITNGLRMRDKDLFYFFFVLLVVAVVICNQNWNGTRNYQQIVHWTMNNIKQEAKKCTMEFCFIFLCRQWIFYIS